MVSILLRRTLPTLALTFAFNVGMVSAINGQVWNSAPFCDSHDYLCAENAFNYINGKHVGHDEPAVLFYSNTPGSGNSSIYNLTLPKDPPRQPRQNGSGGIFNFELNGAFWFGMVMCDSESFPEFTSTCLPDTDTNIADNPDPAAPDYIGKHPGAAYMELQFYPPGWVTSYCGKHWCAGLTIDSFSYDPNDDVYNNAQCLGSVGREPANFAFVTKNGIADAPGSPLHLEHFVPNPSNDLLMEPGDNITIDMHDTNDGFEVILYDNTTHRQGSMKASIANGFVQVKFAPEDSSCTFLPHAFHPMYATSGPHTLLTWGADTFNIAFVDEIGHFDYCESVDANGICTQPAESDHLECIAAKESPLTKIGGCIDADTDFDGVSYNANWPGTDPSTDAKFHPTPISFTSPVFSPTAGGPLANYDTSAFEADTPAIESGCDTVTALGCANPPAGAQFYPFFSIGKEKSGACTWRFGGAGIAGTLDTFDDVLQYGALLSLDFPLNGATFSRFDVFRSIPQRNPCEAPSLALRLPTKPIDFGKVSVGKTSGSRALRIANPTALPITLFGITVPSDYHLAAGKQTTCSNPGVLAPGGTCQYGLTLTPASEGPDSGTATILSNAKTATSTVSLIGTGR
jgi:hypothetical protein